MLRQCGIRFAVMTPAVEEPLPTANDIRAWVRRWALRKAMSVVKRAHSDLIWGADTVVVIDGQGLGKPTDAGEARAMLRRLSGATHDVITGVAVVTGDGSRKATGASVSRVTFRRLLRMEIDRYVATGEPFDKAGAYAIQGGARAFVRSVEGPLDNVIGLPIQRLGDVTRRIAI